MAPMLVLASIAMTVCGIFGMNPATRSPATTPIARKLAASRAFVLVAYFTQSHEMLFDAHTKAFEVFGGVPKRGIYDNMRTAVDKIRRGKQRQAKQRTDMPVSHVGAPTAASVPARHRGRNSDA